MAGGSNLVALRLSGGHSRELGTDSGSHMITTGEVRRMFLDFFGRSGHLVSAGGSLVPDAGSGLMFTNAGMNQFRKSFLGLEKPRCSRIVTSQMCVRAGGKHNDLQQVGYTKNHHTLFEMLGSFSFDDYFKREAICLAWELLTGKDWFSLPEEKFLVTVCAGDEETYGIWRRDVRLPPDRIVVVGEDEKEMCESENFWRMGDTGPCGPCSEIFFRNSSVISTSRLKNVPPDEMGCIEVWNLVFMQFNLCTDGRLVPLSGRCVDTGMGLERITSVLLGVDSTYEIDLFRDLIGSILRVIQPEIPNETSLRIIADHIRSSAFLVGDGILPSAKGRGYVLRRIIRRAILHGRLIGAGDMFFGRLVDPLLEVIGEAGDRLSERRDEIEQILLGEEKQFLQTLQRGLDLLYQKISRIDGEVLDGETVFLLHDTYGLPFDLTSEVCRRFALRVDEVAFRNIMIRSRGGHRRR